MQTATTRSELNNGASAPTSGVPQRRLVPNIVCALLAIVGLCDATYLTIEHLAGESVRCTVAKGCSTVLASSYASIGGVPLAAFGMLAYFTAFSLATLVAFGYTRASRALRLLIALMFMTTLALLFIQAFVLHAFCDFCLLSAVVITLLTIIVAVDYFRARSLAA